MEKEKPDLAIWQIVNMSIGFFGIQHGFEIQFARMSSIYEKLGAQPEQIPFLWLAAPGKDRHLDFFDFPFPFRAPEKLYHKFSGRSIF